MAKSPLTNADLADLLALEAEDQSGTLARAYRRAARSAFLWPDSVAEMLDRRQSLLELHGVGPFIAKKLSLWVDKPPRQTIRRSTDRRDFLTMADARALLRRKPEWAKLLRGDLQMHTVWSDGSGTVVEMGEAARERGYDYIGITDHSKGLKIAGGINEAELHQQGMEIARANAAIRASSGGLTILRSIEMNLNPRGEGDMEEGALNQLDLVLGSFHSALRLKDDQTPRYLAAIQNRSVHILGHPRGRIYNYRLGLKADWPRVFAEAARLDKALEIDCYPDRQDLNVSLLKVARKEGARISLGTDAHHPWQLEFISLGLAAALKAKVPAERIVNFMKLDELKIWVANLRRPLVGRAKKSTSSIRRRAPAR
jgi:histidinol phosphatase-like PHP family hydrolase